MKYPLPLILLIVLGAVLSGVTGWEGMQEWAEDHRAWLSRWFDLEHNLPSADTLRRVMERLRPQTFVQCFEAWARSLLPSLRGCHLAIDGKSVQGSASAQAPTVPLHLLHVYAVGPKLLLAAQPIAGAPAEPAQIPSVLALLELQGTVITADANACSKRVTAAVIECEGDYVLALKGNRGPQYAEVRNVLGEMEVRDFEGVARRSCEEWSEGHGRSEVRRAVAVSARHFPRVKALFAGVRSVVRIERTRQSAQEASYERAYYISSLPADASKLAGYVRAHWAVESELHGALDVVLHEDGSRARTRHAPTNVAMIRRFAFTLLKRDQTAAKRSLKGKMYKADRDDDYRTHLLAQQNP